MTIFIIPPNIEVLKKRLLNRHLGEESLVDERMNKFSQELSHWQEYDWILVNDDLELCYKDILNIISQEKKGIKNKQDKKIIEKKINALMS